MSREDGARFSPQPTRNKSCCSVNGCYSKACRDLTVRFHSFPKSTTDFVKIPNQSGALEKISRRDAWARLLMMDKAITENTRICSLHFKRSDYILPDAPTQKRYLKRDAIPSCNLPLTANRNLDRDAEMTSEANEEMIKKRLGNDAVTNRMVKRKKLEPTGQLETNAGCKRDRSERRRGSENRWKPEIKEEPMESVMKLEPQDEEINELYSYTDDQDSCTNKNADSYDFPMKQEPEEIEIKFESVDLPDVDLNIADVPRVWQTSSGLRGDSSQKSSWKSRDAATQTDDRQLRAPKFSDVIKTSRDLNVLTGIPSFGVLGTITDVVKIASPRLARAKGLRLDVEDRVIMTFMKMKQDLTYGALAAFFKCKTRKSCKRIVLRTLETLSCCLKFAIRWPARHESCGRSPDFPDYFSNVRCVISRIEVAIKRPEEVFERVMTFSSYKRRYSAKFMTAVTPAGFVCLLSRAYGGRTSHRTLFEQSQLVKFLERNDALMALKDFPIDDICQKHNITLVKSLYSRDPREPGNPASYRLRLNVNRRIRRFRIFRGKLSNTLATRAEQILTILCAVENLASLTSDVAVSKRS